MTLHVDRSAFDTLRADDRIMVQDAVDAMCEAFKAWGWNDFPNDDRLADMESFVGAFVANNKAAT